MYNKRKILFCGLVVFIAIAVLITNRAFSLYSDIIAATFSVEAKQPDIRIENIVIDSQSEELFEYLANGIIVTVQFDIVNDLPHQIKYDGRIKLAFHDESLTERYCFFVYPGTYDDDSIRFEVFTAKTEGAIIGFEPIFSNFKTSVGDRDGIEGILVDDVILEGSSTTTYELKLLYFNNYHIQDNIEAYNDQMLEFIVEITDSETSDNWIYDNYQTMNTKVFKDEDPVITLNGDNPHKMYRGEEYIEPGATAINMFGNPVSVIITGSVDVNTVGNYEITYIAIDNYGKKTVVTRSVSVLEAEPASTEVEEEKVQLYISEIKGV